MILTLKMRLRQPKTQPNEQLLRASNWKQTMVLQIANRQQKRSEKNDNWMWKQVRVISWYDINDAQVNTVQITTTNNISEPKGK